MASCRIRSSVFALLSLGLVSTGVCGIFYGIGRATDPEARFLEPRRAPTADEATAIYPIQYALTSDEPNDVLFVGDSACRHGIDPRAFTRVTHHSAYNLGTFLMMGPRASSIAFRAYLTKHPAPKVVVLCLAASSLCIGNRDDATPPKEVVVNFPRQFADDYGPVIGDRPILSIPFLIRAGAKAAQSHFDRLQGKPDPRDVPLDDPRAKGGTFRSLQAEQLSRRGFWPLPERAEDADKLPPPILFIDADWSAMLKEMASVCRERGIKCLVRFMPLRKDASDQCAWDKFERWANAVDGVTVCQPFEITYPDSLMWNGVHLNARGVEKFAPVIAADVQRVLGERQEPEK